MTIDVTKPNIAQLIITISTFTLSKAVKIKRTCHNYIRNNILRTLNIH